ncbi:MAG: YesL family protein [Eubacterium sp.]|nr:YesL family protein [Eubacterium sp.]
MFSYDSTFLRVMTKIADVFIVSVLWIIFSIPIVTLGASTSALYYTVHKVIIGDRGYVTKDFWKQFKDHIKDSIIISLILEVVFIFLLYDVTFVKAVLEQDPDHKIGVFYYFFYILIFVVVIYFIYVFCYRARYEMGIKGSFMNGVRFFFLSAGWAFLIFAALVVTVMIVRDMPFFILVLPALNAMLWNFIMEKQYYKVMTPEEKEEERKLKLIRRGRYELVEGDGKPIEESGQEETLTDKDIKEEPDNPKAWTDSDDSEA